MPKRAERVNMLWTEILSGDFEKAVERSKGVCGLVVGCVEHHGRHLPLGMDVFHTAGVAELAAKKEPFVLFPHMYFGEKQGAGEFKGTIIFSSKLMFDILTESCDEMARNGIKKIIIVNGHGGNIAMLNNFARSTLYRKKDYMVLIYRLGSAGLPMKRILEMIETGERPDLFSELTEEDVAAIRYNVENRTASGHGCFSETAISLGLFPELCDMSRVNDVIGKNVHRLSHLSDEGFYTPFGWMADYPNSLSSDAHDGNNERIGKAFVNLTVERLANAFKVIKEDTAIEEYHKEWCEKQ